MHHPKVVTIPSYMILMRETSGYCLDARYRYGGQPMFFRLNPRGGKLPGKQVRQSPSFSQLQLSTKSGRPHPWHRASSWGWSRCKGWVGPIPQNGSRQGLRVPNSGHISIWLKIQMFRWAFWEVEIKVMLCSSNFPSSRGCSDGRSFFLVNNCVIILRTMHISFMLLRCNANSICCCGR